MKHSTTFVLVIALAVAAGTAVAQQRGDMKGMDMPMKDMPMKDMPMKDMPMDAAQGQVHHASGTVKKIDATKAAVTFAHGPVESLNWPSMTMDFRLKDKALLDKLAVGKQVEFEFVKEGAAYVVTAVR